MFAPRHAANLGISSALAVAILGGMTAETANERPAILGYLGPNWFASVMGTGIVANAGATLPVHVGGLRTFALVVRGAAAL